MLGKLSFWWSFSIKHIVWLQNPQQGGEWRLLLRLTAHICLSWIVPGTLWSPQLGLARSPVPPQFLSSCCLWDVDSEILVTDPVLIVQGKVKKKKKEQKQNKTKKMNELKERREESFGNGGAVAGLLHHPEWAWSHAFWRRDNGSEFAKSSNVLLEQEGLLCETSWC